MVDHDEDILAECAALNMVAIKSLRAITTLMALQGMDSSDWLNSILENGLDEIARGNYRSVPADRKEAFVEKAQMRYTDLIVASR